MAIKVTRTWMMAAALALGVAGSMVPSTADAAPPPGADEKARDAYAKARKLLREAAALEKQADDERDAAKDKYIASLKRANQLDRDAEAKKAEARRLLQVAGKWALNEMRADALRNRARSLFNAARDAQAAAERYDAAGDAEKQRAKAQRDAAAQLLANNPDPQMKADAADLIKQAEQDEKDAADYEAKEKEARKKAQDLRTAALALIAQANRLDPDGT